jgi:hypothetical protein
MPEIMNWSPWTTSTTKGKILSQVMIATALPDLPIDNVAGCDALELRCLSERTGVRGAGGFTSANKSIGKSIIKEYSINI